MKMRQAAFSRRGFQAPRGGDPGGPGGSAAASRQSPQRICRFSDRIKDRCQEVIRQIAQAGRLGAARSAMFEDMDHMISRIPPIVREVESGR